MIYYKLTDSEGYTRRGRPGETRWGENVTHRAREKGRELCTNQVIHGYRDPLLAQFMNPIHANLSDPICWELRGCVVADDGTKLGFKTATTLRRVDLPGVTIAQRVRFGILCALEVYHEPSFVAWAQGWLSGPDRSAAEAAARAAEAARAAAKAARAAAWAAWAAAWARAAEAAAEAAWAAAWAEAAEAARAAARAARATDIDLVAIAHRAVEEV